jgi:hypothetical protein
VAEQRPHAEDLALADLIDGPAVVDDLDGALAHDVEVPGGFAGLTQDHRPRREVLDLHGRDDPGESLGVERVEGRVARQERDDLHVDRSLRPGDVAHADGTAAAAIRSVPPSPSTNRDP